MTAQSQRPAGEMYANRIDELRHEIRHAMAAISANKLHALEESLWRQEVLCTGLKHLLGVLGTAAPASILSSRLQASLTALDQLNQSYAELLRQAQTSNHLLHALCQSHRSAAQEQNDPAIQRYSLEV